MEAILGIVAKFVQCFVDPVGDELSYLSEYKRNIEILHQETDTLNHMRDGVQMSVDEAIRSGNEIKPIAGHWLIDVEQNVLEATQLEIESTAENRLFRGLFPNYLFRYRFSKKAFKKTMVINELKGSKPSVQDISIRLPPINIHFPHDSKRARPEGEVVQDKINSEKGEKVARGSTPTLNEKYVQGKQMVNDIIAQQREPVQQIIFQQKEAVDQIFDGLQDDDCEIIGVYGMGGIGKTTLVKEIGKMAEVCGLFDKILLIVVSQKQDVRKIQGEIADILGVQFTEESEMGRAGRLHERLVGKERILLILDDVWETVNLTDIGIPRGALRKNFKILITSRQRNICSIMGFHKRMEIPMKLLSDKASCDLLKLNAELDDSVSPQLDAISMEMARECGGVPLAVVTVGRALLDKDLEEWKSALHLIKVSKQLNISNVEKDVFSCIKLSYDYLKSEEARACLLLCCLFPEDHDIKIEDIARYGMGKGLYTNVVTMEETRMQTRWIIRNLKDSCLLLDSSKDGCVKMHDVVRDCAISIAYEKKMGFIVKSGIGLKEWPNSNAIEEKVIISLMANSIQELPDGLFCPQLEMLLLGENDGFEVIPEGFFEGMASLKVLDLSERIGARSLKHYFGSSSSIPNSTNFLRLPSSFGVLLNLQTLYLEHCNLVDIRILGKLRKLEILSLYGSDIKEPPYEISCLSKLRLLDLNFCQNLTRVPAYMINKLFRLQELYMGVSFRGWEVAEVEKRSIAHLSEVASLSQLTNLCLQVSNPRSLPLNLHFQSLDKFEIAIGLSFNRITCYPKSRSLYIEKVYTSIPESVKHILQVTEDLTLNCLKDDLVKNVLCFDQGGLTSLKSLTVLSCEDTSFLLTTQTQNGSAVLSCLEKLILRYLAKLMQICGQSLPSGSLEKLEILEVRSCPLLSTIVTAPLVQMLLNLKEIEVDDCDDISTIFELGKIVPAKKCLLLSNLRKIKLHLLPELQFIWSGRNHILPFVSLTKLKEVEISSCRNLSYVFSNVIARSLLQLEEIEVIECDSLVNLFSNEDEGKEFSKNKKHKEKEGKDEEEKETRDGMIFLPRLNSIRMTGLRNLNRICAEHFSVDFPSLQELVLVSCPKLSNFASDTSRYGLNSAPRLQKAQIGEDTIVGEAASQLLNKKEKGESTTWLNHD